MWMHHDSGWWGLVIAIVGVVLAYPIDVLAHLTVPIVKNWWAERSAASMRKRIEKLEKQLADEEQNYPPLSVVEEQMFKGIEGLGALGTLCVQFLVICFLLAVAQFSPTPLITHNVIAAVVLAVFISVGGYAIAYGVFGKLTTFRKKRSPSAREVLKKSIEELKKRLAQRTSKS